MQSLQESGERCKEVAKKGEVRSRRVYEEKESAKERRRGVPGASKEL